MARDHARSIFIGIEWTARVTGKVDSHQQQHMEPRVSKSLGLIWSDETV